MQTVAQKPKSTQRDRPALSANSHRLYVAQSRKVHSILHAQKINRKSSANTYSKLNISNPGDKFEQEADRVAERVMSMDVLTGNHPLKGNTAHKKPLSSTVTPLIQRQVAMEEEEELLQSVSTTDADEMSSFEEEVPLLDSLPTTDNSQLSSFESYDNSFEEYGSEEEEELIQPKSNMGSSQKITSKIESDIHSFKGKGYTLPASERRFFEPRFGTDFSKVRIHTNDHAAHTSQAINARAFTIGNDVVFAAGQFSPGTHSGRQLMAHELTHVIQQGNSSIISRKPKPFYLEGLFEQKPVRSEDRVATRWQDLDDKDIEIAKTFNHRNYTLERSIAGIAGLVGPTHVRVFNTELILGIARYQQRYHLRVDGQVGRQTLRHFTRRLIGAKADYTEISDAIWMVIDGLGFRSGRAKSIVYNPRQTKDVTVLDDRISIRLGIQARQSYSKFVNALKRGLRLVNRPRKRTIKSLKSGNTWLKTISQQLGSNSQVDRDELKKYSRSRPRSKKNLSPLHRYFVKNIESSHGKDERAWLNYLKNTNHTVKCWPSELYPYEVTITGPSLNLVKSRYPDWVSKVSTIAKQYEPRISDPKIYAAHVLRFSAFLPSQMQDLIKRYSGLSPDKVKDERILIINSYVRRPNKLKWTSLSSKMRGCLRSAIRKGFQKGINAFTSCAYALHNKIIIGINHIKARYNSTRLSHEYKNIMWRLKIMASNVNSAMYSYRKNLNIGLLTQGLAKFEKAWNKYFTPFK